VGMDTKYAKEYMFLVYNFTLFLHTQSCHAVPSHQRL
jgi:hypothetical protein